ncbi:hypothetical protein [Actinoplanes siamensis]|uniref:hypothetical protein n=1 Tax=Actinoplanes siamensis TaxID=1223317 RepID=UPI001944464C|nr:hypothetical protein [Actinoplanes siamensis]
MPEPALHTGQRHPVGDRVRGLSVPQIFGGPSDQRSPVATRVITSGRQNTGVASTRRGR